MIKLFNKLFGEEAKAKRQAKKEAKKLAEKQKVLSLLKKDGNVVLSLDLPSKKLYSAEVIKDEFNGDLSIKFVEVSSYGGDKIMTFADGDFCPIDIGFRFQQNQHYMAIACYQKILKFKKGDKFSFLFTNGEIIDFEISEKGYRLKKDHEGVVIENKIPITNDTIVLFEENDIDKWRYTPSDGGRLWTSTFSDDVRNNMKEMATAYGSLIDMFLEEEEAEKFV